MHVEDAIKKSIAKEIYLSILDVSFSHTGGSIAIIDKEYTEKVKNEYIFRDDLDRVDQKDEKKQILKRLIEAGVGNEYRLFHILDRKLRQDLLSLDGATVIDSYGKILSIGSIVKISGGSDEGGRTAATKQLACYGLGIKVSEDGHITAYGRNKDEPSYIEKVFTLF